MTRSQGGARAAWVGFVAGALAVPLAHQPVLWLTGELGLTPWPVYSLAPRPPFGVPAILSLSFWGGVWGAALWVAVRRRVTRLPQAVRWGAALGAVLPNAVGAVLISLGGGVPTAGADPRALLLAAILINAAWGVATIVFSERAAAREA